MTDGLTLIKAACNGILNRDIRGLADGTLVRSGSRKSRRLKIVMERSDEKVKKRISILAAALLLGIACLTGCTRTEKEEITSVGQLDDPRYTIGVGEGTAGMYLMEEYFPGAAYKIYTDGVTAYMAVEQGKLDAFVYDRVMMEFAIANGLTGVRLLDENIGESMDVAVGISPKTEIPGLPEKVNRFLAELREAGTLDDMYYRWVQSADKTMPEIPKPEAPDCKLRVGTTGLVQPFSYYEGSTLTGYDIELIYRFAEWMNAEVEIRTYDYGGIIAAAESGDIDCIMGNLNATEERRQHILFSDCVYPSVTAVMVRTGAAGEEENAQKEYRALSDFSGERFGAMSGSVADKLVQGVIDDAEDFSYFYSVSDIAVAIKMRRIDAGALDEPLARLAAARNGGLLIFEEPVVPDKYGYAFPKGSPLCAQFDGIIAQLKEDGTIEELKEKWLGADESVKVLTEQTWDGTNGTIVYYFGDANEPMTYVGSGGEPLGLEIDLMLLIAQKLDMKVEMIPCEFGGLIAALESGKADVASGSMSITEERMKHVDFSDSHYDAALVLLIRDESSLVNGNKKGFLEGLRDSFNSTFIVEGRWKLILRGLGVTALISVFSGIFGLLLGFVLCMLRRIPNRPVRFSVAAFVRLIQGTPIVVFLMILYYVVFGSSDVSGILVAIIGFSINFGAYTSEMMRSGIETVDKGQNEAALAMGYTKARSFFNIIFPQAARNFLPVLKGEFISMVKMTSVVGYIAVQDLTKVSDIIRSRTMEAFFPLIVTAAIYFVLANAMTAMLSFVEHRIEPKRRKRTVKGVRMVCQNKA